MASTGVCSTPSMIFSLTIFCLLLCTACYFIYDSVRKIRSKHTSTYEELVSSVYEDEDGVATTESQKQQASPAIRWIAATIAILGFFISFSLAVLVTLSTVPCRQGILSTWLTFAAWAILFLSVVHVMLQRSPLRRFQHGLLCSIACLAMSIQGFFLMFVSLPEVRNTWRQGERRNLVLYAFQGIAGLATCLACLLLPRRPSVEVDNHVVDRQYTTSALGRWTLAWATDVLSLARSTGGLEVSDLPLLDCQNRSKYLLRGIEVAANQRPIWKALVIIHWPALLFQTFLAVLGAVFAFAPQLIMYGLLRLLERDVNDAPYAKEATLLVLALLISIILDIWTNTWNWWISYALVASPVKSEISALVFTKSIRRKDVKGTRKLKPLDGQEARDFVSIDPEVRPAPTIHTTPNALQDELGEDVEKTRQGTINLVSVDARRVSNFLRLHFIFISAAAEMAVNLTFLLKLLGWEPVTAGFAMFLLTLPMNIWMSKNFASSQDKLMSVRDRKLVVLTEALQGIRQIKFSAQEVPWQKKIEAVRGVELSTLWRTFYLDCGLIFCWIIGPVILSTVALAVYALVHGELSASVAFTSLTVFSTLEFSLGVIPEFTTDALEAWVSVKRIDEYLAAPETTKYTKHSEAIVFSNASISWPSDTVESDTDNRFVLRDINLRIPARELSVVSGPTGAGKSLLLASLIGEADLLGGTLTIPDPPSTKERNDQYANKSDWVIDSAVSYVAQIPWIENASIKQNILFGLPFDQGRYNKTIECCALKKDLDIMPDGDSTDIGFNGINLSGGQRWRVSFARALYSRAGILVLDDIFSAVDAHVGRQLFEEALTGDLGINRTRILVTHHVALVLPRAAYIVALADGTIQYCGLPEDFRATGASKDILGSPDMDHKNDAPMKTANITTFGDYDLRKIVSHKSNIIDEDPKGLGRIQPKKFVEVEGKERGSVKRAVWITYLRTSGGIPWWLSGMVLYLAYEALTLGRSWWITIWTRSYKEVEAATVLLLRYSNHQPSKAVFNRTQDSDLPFYLGAYLGISIALCCFGATRYLFVYTRSLSASKALFDKMTYTILRAPLRWLDTVPVGRILNRFTADFEAIDSRLGNELGFLLYCIIKLAGILIAGLFVSPWVILMAFVLLVICAYLMRVYLVGAREVKRLESIAKSPIFEQFGSTLAGIGTIRAFAKTEIYVDRMMEKIDAYSRCYWHLWLLNRWMSLWLDLSGAIFTTLVATIIIYADIDASLAGFALTFALQYSGAVTEITRFYANVELSMNAVERVIEWSEMPIEPQDSKIETPAAWPTEGRLEVDDLVVGYAPDLPPVLKGLSFQIGRNQRVGVVGRTGAGKSSLTLALFRFLEARGGSIVIDGINIADISLQSLRSRLAIIPQDPVLFSGTVRSNLDPFDEHTEDELQDALQRVQLARSGNTSAPPSRAEPANQGQIDSIADAEPTVPNQDDGASPSTPNTTAAAAHTSGTGGTATLALPAKNAAITLDTPISESGLNLSQGQRQLLCLARAIVRRPKILVLDEATSAVDMATDLLIQRSIREEFRDSTLLVIAHRLSTIADFDRILVMEEGKGVEFGPPRELLEKSGKEKGVFWGMVEESGEREGLRDVILGRDKGKGRAD